MNERRHRSLLPWGCSSQPLNFFPSPPRKIRPPEPVRSRPSRHLVVGLQARAVRVTVSTGRRASRSRRPALSDSGDNSVCGNAGSPGWKPVLSTWQPTDTCPSQRSHSCQNRTRSPDTELTLGAKVCCLAGLLKSPWEFAVRGARCRAGIRGTGQRRRRFGRLGARQCWVEECSRCEVAGPLFEGPRDIVCA